MTGIGRGLGGKLARRATDEHPRHEGQLRRCDEASRAAGTAPAIDTTRLLADFDEVAREAGEARPEDAETLEDRAERLERLRAYVYPPAEVHLEGRSVLSDMALWGVPGATLTKLQTDLMSPVTGENIVAARGALRVLFGQRDYWAWYVDWYTSFMERTAWWLLALEVVALAIAINRFVYGDVILGFMAAGACGALVSVISKMPPLMADAESNAYVRRILMRVGRGFAAAVIGGGFLASGVITISLPVGTVTALIEECGRPRDATPPTTAPGAGTQCTTGGILLLLGIAMVLGFSERALTSFEERVFPAAGTPAKESGTT